MTTEHISVLNRTCWRGCLIHIFSMLLPQFHPLVNQSWEKAAVVIEKSSQHEYLDNLITGHHVYASNVPLVCDVFQTHVNGTCFEYTKLWGKCDRVFFCSICDVVLFKINLKSIENLRSSLGRKQLSTDGKNEGRCKWVGFLVINRSTSWFCPFTAMTGQAIFIISNWWNISWEEKWNHFIQARMNLRISNPSVCVGDVIPNLWN